MNKEFLNNENKKMEAENCQDAPGGLLGCSTHIGSKTINEDACGSDCIDGWKVIILADGVGSALRADEASKIAVEAFLT